MGALEGHIVSGADLFAPHGADLAVDGDLAALDPLLCLAAGGHQIGEFQHAFLKAQETGKAVTLCCAIGDDTVDGRPYAEIVEIAQRYIRSVGGFEGFAEWGLV